MILVLKMTKKYHITWYWCQNIRNNMVEKRVKKFGQGPPPPPFRAMPERNRFLLWEVFPNIWILRTRWSSNGLMFVDNSEMCNNLSHLIKARVNSHKIPIWRLCWWARSHGGDHPGCHFPYNKPQCIHITLKFQFTWHLDKNNTCLNDSKSDSFIELSRTSGARYRFVPT